MLVARGDVLANTIRWIVRIVAASSIGPMKRTNAGPPAWGDPVRRPRSISHGTLAG
jgi:hypothetical protein